MALNRSLLFVPGSNEAAIADAPETAADTVVIDLEDAVSHGNKDAAREVALSALEEWNTEIPLGIRINGIDTPRGIADVEAIVTADTEPEFLAVPDVRGVSDLRAISDILSERETAIELLPLIEQPSAVFAAEDIANAPRIYGLLFAAIDFQMNMGMSVLGESDISLPRYLVSMAASSAGVPAFDKPLLVTDDEEQLRAETKTARTLGYDGKLAVNHEQAKVINDVFTPSKKEVAEAREIIEAFNASDEGLVDVGGTVVDKPVIEQLRDVIRRAEAEERDGV